MRLRVRYRAQETSSTCGPAALQMALGVFGILRSQRSLARELATNAETGTDHAHLIRAVTDAGLFCAIRERATLRDARPFLLQGLPVIVHYTEPSEHEGHYAVVVGLDRWRITLHDPWNGAGFTLSRRAFERRWYDGDRKHPKWFMALSSHEISGGSHFHPTA